MPKKKIESIDVVAKRVIASAILSEIIALQKELEAALTPVTRKQVRRQLRDLCRDIIRTILFLEQLGCHVYLPRPSAEFLYRSAK